MRRDGEEPIGIPEVEDETLTLIGEYTVTVLKRWATV